MKTPARVGVVAATVSVFVAIAVLANTDKGRVTQEGALLELIAFIMFLYAGLKGSRWWFAGILAVIIFWVTAAHLDFLWK